MELSHTFTVDLPPDQAWTVLTDLERVAACLPGAALDGLTSDGCRGSVRLKVGPVTARYQGAAAFLEKDQATGRAVIRAEGRDTGGQGSAAATVTATLSPLGSGTEVSVLTELALSGRVAQFGRGIIADVSGRLLGQFVRQLEEEITGIAPAATAPAGTAPAGTAPAGTAPAGTGLAGGSVAAGTAPAASASAPGGGQASGRAGARPAGGDSAAVDVLAVARGALAARARPALARALPAAAVLAVACGAAFVLGRRSGRRDLMRPGRGAAA